MTLFPVEGPRTVPAGGPATINGILYQLLWSLLRASKAYVTDVSMSPGGDIQKTTLTLEPIGGGGDLVVGTVSGRIVEQVKARPDGGTWSLREIVEDVIPDLYLASSEHSNEMEYRLVTEGRMGRWKDVYGFFQSLRAYCPPNDGPLPDLDQDTPLRFGGVLGSKSDKAGPEDSFWELDTYTQASLFEKIVSVVRKRSGGSSEPIETTRRRMWRVLSRFTFVGGQAMSDVQAEIDACLLALVDHRERLPDIRDAMAFDLGRRASTGSATIDASEFLTEHGINAVPLNNWPLFRSQTERYVDAYLARHGYVQDLDVRFENAVREIREWPPTRPILLISGESGQGKSWRAYAIALAARSLPCVTVIVDATGDADATLERVARALWQDIGNHDATIPLSQIARRVQHVSGTGPTNNGDDPWLVLVIDGIQEEDEARRLIQEPWEAWGVRVAFTCSSHVASQIRQSSPLRCFPIRVSDFRIQELQDYLLRAIGEEWVNVPDHTREPLRRPLLAQIFCRLTEEAHLHPSNEYGIYQSLWDRLTHAHPFDSAALMRVGEAVLDGGTYPLSVDELAAASIDQQCLRRLEALGWLRTVVLSPHPQFDISHDRLLNWLIAAVLTDRLKSGREAPTIIADRLRGYLSHRSRIGGREMGFVPMDAIWMMLRDSVSRDNVVEVLDRLNDQPIRSDILYRELVPTLGPEVVDVLLEQLRLRIGNLQLSHLITGAIGRVGGDKATDVARQLLNESDPMLVRGALRILADAPVADVLDRLWQIQVAAKRDPAPFLAEHESKYSVLGESFKALCRCSALHPEWLEERIAEVAEGDPAAETLTNLVAEIGGSAGRLLWERNKRALFSKVPSKTQRCLAVCIDIYGDVQETDWLIEHLSSADDLVCSKALSALARLNPDLAVENLDRLPRRYLAPTRNWYGDRLFAVRKSAVQVKMLEMMRGGGPSWELASVYDGRAHLLDAPTLRYLLEDLSGCLEGFLSDPQTKSREPELYSRLSLLASLGTLEQLGVFAEYRESPLAEMLSELLERIGPQRGIARDSHVRSLAFVVLHRIGGEQYTHAVNRFLDADSQFARYDAIRRIARRPDGESILLLQQIAESDRRWNGEPDGPPLEQDAAAEVLADSGEWEHVLQLVSKLGCRTSKNITDLARSGLRPPARCVQPIIARVRATTGEVPPGDILAIGMGGNPADSPILLEVLGKASPETETAHAGAVSLELVADDSESAVSTLAKVLPHHEYSAINALIANGTQAAISVLWEHTKQRLDVAVLINVLNKWPQPEQLLDEVKALLASELDSHGSRDFAQILDLLVDHLHSADSIALLLTDDRLREHVYRQSFADEGNSWITGSKAASIRVLAKLNEEAAFMAARTALRNPEWHDRDHYPCILADLALKDAVPELLRQLSVEENSTVARAICRALLREGVDDHLLTALGSEDCQIRRASCIAAGWASTSDIVAQRLTTLVEDMDEDVSDAAASALCRLRLRAECRRLTEAIMCETDSRERWRLLDGLVVIGDPGDSHRPWPREGAPIGEVLTPLQVRYCISELEELRKKCDMGQSLLS